MAEQELANLDLIEGKLRKVRGDVESRKSNPRPRSLNLTTLYCSEVPAAQASPISLVKPSTPAPSIVSTTPSVTPSPAILVRHRPLSPPGLRLQRSVSSSSYQPPLRRALYRQTSTASSLRRNRAAEYSKQPCSRACQWVSEVSLLIIGLRHLIAEVPLLVLIIRTQGLGALFYLTLAATISPGPAALIAVIRSGVAQGTSILHSGVRCVALTLRLESLLRLLELLVWWRGGAAWRSHVAVAQAAAGSTPQLLFQAMALGLCTRHVLERDVTGVTSPDEEHFFHFRGEKQITGQTKDYLCDPSLVLLQCWVLVVSALHVAWALSTSSKPNKLPPKYNVDPLVWQLVRRTSSAVGIVANLLLSGSRTVLVVLAVSSGWATWKVGISLLIMLGIMCLVQLLRRCLGKPHQEIPMTICSLIAVEPGATCPRVLARRCVVFVAGNAVMLVAIAIRTHGAEASGQVYRVAVLHAAAAITGTLLLFARLRWVHVTSASPSPISGGKCLSQYPPNEDM